MSFIDEHARTVDVSGATTRIFDSGGPGSIVVVLHGWGGRIESMAPVLSCLRSEHRVIALDLPGFGASPAPPTPWGTPEYAAFVKDALAQLEVSQAHFVGHSFGGKVSLCLAATEPGVVERLVLTGSSGLRLAPSTKVRIKRLLSRGAKAIGLLGPFGRRARAAIYDRIASQDYKEAGPLRAILVRVVNEDFRDLLPGIASSTLLIWGTEDDAVPMSHARIFEASIPDAGLVTFEGAGHFAYLDESDRFCTIVSNFLRGGS